MLSRKAIFDWTLQRLASVRAWAVDITCIFRSGALKHLICAQLWHMTIASPVFVYNYACELPTRASDAFDSSTQSLPDQYIDNAVCDAHLGHRSWQQSASRLLSENRPMRNGNPFSSVDSAAAMTLKVPGCILM